MIIQVEMKQKINISSKRYLIKEIGYGYGYGYDDVTPCFFKVILPDRIL